MKKRFWLVADVEKLLSLDGVWKKKETKRKETYKKNTPEMSENTETTGAGWKENGKIDGTLHMWTYSFM